LKGEEHYIDTKV